MFRTGLHGLLPFIPLTREGKQREAIERVINELSQEEVGKQRELLSFTYGFASLVFKDEDDQYWLKGIFGMLKDILKESWAFQEIAQEAREEAYRTVLQRLRHALLSFIQARFPALVRLAEKQCKAIETSEQMEELLRNVILAQDEQEVRLGYAIVNCCKSSLMSMVMSESSRGTAGDPKDAKIELDELTEIYKQVLLLLISR